ncbi:hypothetical protein F2Q68_00004459 [Brassica cretica]|uniref:Uncharacterized protein n=1 Tax=Brassica cretica TaxID=69181 RepID=A0A8S9JN82_BRACR|nr:hypothetical protein F2Q68_00004459 [Brassica cretica]
MGDQDKEKNMENPDVVQRYVMGRGSISQYGWSVWPNRGSGRFRLILMDQSMTCKVKTNTRLSAGSGKEVHWAVDLEFMIGRSNLDFGWMDRLDMVDRFRLYVIILIDELRMVLVKRRSCEGSVSERLCSVLLDDASLRVQLGREVRIGSYMDRVGPFACWRLRSRNPGSPSEDPNGRTWLLVTWTVPDRSPAGDPDRLLGFGASVTDQQERGFFWGLGSATVSPGSDLVISLLVGHTCWVSSPMCAAVYFLQVTNLLDLFSFLQTLQRLQQIGIEGEWDALKCYPG